MNDYLIDREMQRNVNYTGLYGINDQDRSLQESMRFMARRGVADRTKEHLGTTDIAIITARRQLVEMVNDLGRGIEPFTALHGDLYKVRSLDIVSPEGEFDKLLDRHTAEMVAQI